MVFLLCIRIKAMLHIMVPQNKAGISHEVATISHEVATISHEVVTPSALRANQNAL